MEPTDDLGRLRRWEDSGALWRVVSRAPDGVEIALLTCDAGEQMGRVHSADPAVIAWVAGRERSDEPAPSSEPAEVGQNDAGDDSRRI
jgi:hypothetical protein